MSWLPINLILSLLFIVSIAAIGILIQVKLSRNENKFLGLVLPILSFLIAFFMVLGIGAFGAFTSTSTIGTVTIESETGEIVEEYEEIVGKVDNNSVTGGFFIIFYVFLVGNVPTVIFSGIYLNERNKMKMKNEIEKMRINDL